jgi:hypothetical protein
MKHPHKRHALELSVKLGLFLSLVILVTILACCFTSFIGLLLVSKPLGEALAHALMPAQYPGSQLIDTEDGGGSAITTRTYTYRTHDAPAQVAAYYERVLPASESTFDAKEYKSEHQRCNNSLPGILVSKVNDLHWRYLPCVSATWDPDSDHSSDTLIYITLSWPG